MTEWGNINLVDEGQGRQLALPGVREGNFSARGFKPQVRVMQVAFSPSGKHSGCNPCPYFFFFHNYFSFTILVRALQMAFRELQMGLQGVTFMLAYPTAFLKNCGGQYGTAVKLWLGYTRACSL